MVRLIAVDIDGTLLDSRGGIPSENRRALADALDAGIEVAIVTGRAFHFALPVVRTLDLPVRIIVSNGALVKAPDGTTLWRRMMPRGVAARILELTRGHENDVAVVFDRPAAGQIVAGLGHWEQPHRVRYYEKNREVIACADPLHTCLTEDPIQVMFNGGVARMQALAGLLRGAATARDYTVVTTEYEALDFTLLDVLAAGVTKGSTLTAWASERGIPPGAIMAVGDNHNDRFMLEVAGVPVVMGNAVPELLDAGWHVTGTNDDAGLAQAVERLALGR